VRRTLRSVPRAGWLCALVAVLAGVCWSIVTPPFEVPDETTHFSYIQHLAQTGSPPTDPKGPVYSTEEGQLLNALKFDLVVGRKGDRGVWSAIEQARVDQVQDGSLDRGDGRGLTNTTSQPPTYYALGSIVYWVSPSHDLLTRVWLLRVLGALLAGLTTLFVYLFLRELMPRHPLSWTAGGMAVAFQPVFGFTAAGVNSDALLFAVAAMLFWAIARAFSRGLDLSTGVVLGIATGLGLLSKINFLGFVPGAALAVLVLLWRAKGEQRREAWRGALAFAALVAVPALVYIGLNVVVWDRSWWAQSLQTQSGTIGEGKGVAAGVPVAQQIGYVWQLYLPRLPFQFDQFPGYFPLYETWWKRFFGVFGWVDYGFKDWTYRLGFIIFLGVVALAVVGLWRGRAALRGKWMEIGVLAVVAGLFLVELGLFGIRYRTETGFEFERGRYLMPLLPLYALVPALAVRGAGARFGQATAVTIILLAFAHTLFSLTLTVSRFYG
jgi:4-amino-4-deoxy-L-arabinose transferase-like glycosyltransferase